MKSPFILSLILLLVYAAPTPAAPLGTRTVLDNGATLLVAERPGIPMVVMNILFKTGAVADPDSKAGLANLTASLLTRGTKKHTTQSLAEALDFLGASLNVDADYETTTVSLTTLTKNLEPAFALVSEVVLSPTFPLAELERTRKEIEGGLQSYEEDPGWVAQKAFLAKLYPHHPYGRLVEGQPATLATLTQADVRKFHQTYYRPNNAIIALAGEITQEQAVDLLHRHFAGWQPADIPSLTWPDSQPPSAERVTLDKKVSQANVVLGHSGIARSNPDYYAVQLMNYILGGGGFGSRLMDKIREELALVYNVGSSFSARKHPGPFTIGLQTKNTTATQALDESLKVVRRFIEQGPTEAELAAAKAYYINSFPLRLVSNRDVGALLPVLEFYELGLDYPDRYADLIGQVTLEQVQKAARTYLHPDQFLQVVVADLKQAGLDHAQPQQP
ncbi:MAG TPA: pitrilysin family protein [Candidatus Binatia bacterium]|jgi:zinc protease|nr:pitrilysin family protein [Candidatus Binatia bacterium]